MAIDYSSKIRQQADLDRKKASRAPYDRILIVCEDSKAAPGYFKEIQVKYSLNTANVQVRGPEDGTDSIQIVECAERLFKHGDAHKDLKQKAFEQVYAVFDRDDHKTYHNALNKMESLNKERLRNDQKKVVMFKAIASVPSFELWLLLHYENIQHPLHRTEVMAKLKKYIHNYKKGMLGIFNKTQDKLETATHHAEQLEKKNTAHNGKEPYTDIHKLVQLLQSLKK